MSGTIGNWKTIDGFCTITSVVEGADGLLASAGAIKTVLSRKGAAMSCGVARPDGWPIGPSTRPTPPGTVEMIRLTTGAGAGAGWP